MTDRERAKGVDEEVTLNIDGISLGGYLTVPDGALGIVAFVHGSGSSRHSPRNRSVADALNQSGIGTLLFDLLSAAEGANRDLVFDIPFLTSRLAAATTWLRDERSTSQLPFGLFGASTGAAAALSMASEQGYRVEAVVSRGGRPDLVESERLAAVTAPTLLIVGERDHQVIEMNEWAASQLTCPNQVVIVPGATHLFEEPGALDQVADLAGAWFGEHLGR